MEHPLSLLPVEVMKLVLDRMSRGDLEAFRLVDHETLKFVDERTSRVCVTLSGRRLYQDDTEDSDELSDERAANLWNAQTPLSTGFIDRLTAQTDLQLTTDNTRRAMEFLLRCQDSSMNDRLQYLLLFISQFSAGLALGVKLAFPNLRHLSVTQSDDEEDICTMAGHAFAPLAGLGLECLKVQGILTVDAIQSVGRLTSLTSLHIGIDRDIYGVQSVDWTGLGALTNLRRATIEMDEFTAFHKQSTLCALTGLEELTMACMSSTGDPGQFSMAPRVACTNLRSLHMTNCIAGEELIESILQMTKLTNLVLEIVDEACHMTTRTARLPLLQDVRLGRYMSNVHIVDVVRLLRALGPLPALTHIFRTSLLVYRDNLRPCMRGVTMHTRRNDVMHCISDLTMYPRLKMEEVEYKFRANATLNDLTKLMRPVGHMVTGLIVRNWVGTVSDDGIKMAQCMPNLTNLHITDAMFNCAALSLMVRDMQQLENLRLDDCGGMRLADWQVLAAAVLQRPDGNHRHMNVMCKPEIPGDCDSLRMREWVSNF